MSDVEVAVVGAGAAGLFCALAAADAGRSVMLFERDRRFVDNANTGRSTGLITAGGTAQQAAAGVSDSPEAYARDLLRKSGGASDPEVISTVAAAAPTVVEVARSSWAAPLNYIPDLPFPGHSVNRAHGPASRKGRYLMEALIEAVRQRTAIELVAGMTVRRLLSGPGGGVTGLTAGPEGGAADPLTADPLTSDRVVLASNGFGANRDWVRRYIPEIADAIYFGGPFSDGAGIGWGMELGAEVATMDAYQGHCSISPDAGTLLPFVLIGSGGVILSLDGKRFGDESVGYSEYAVAVARQPQNLGWEVFDGASHQAAQPYEDFRESIMAGVVRECAGLQELAARTGLPRVALETELDEMATSAATGHADRFGRIHRRPLQTPLYAVRVAAALFHTQGGLRVDGRARVLRRGGEPIAGLYAAGGTAAGMSGHGAAGYMAGNGLTAAAVLGYLAGIDDGRP
jgi:fumarate reductase flavoprotein subunit